MNESTLTKLEALIESAVAPILATRARKRKMREEMLAHLTAIFDEEFVRTGNEADALQTASQRFGEPAELSRQLQATITPLGYVAWFLDEAWLLRGKQAVINHDRMYTILLVALWLYVAGGLTVLAWILNISPEARPDLQWPEWSLPFFAWINGFFLAAMSLTLFARWVWPEAGKRLTGVLNALFLLSPPVGTALGLYGLFWVDRNPNAEGAK
jgi:hypothetical protein